ncbi:MAG: hypothetical protein QGG19_14855 [Alphaproteobacteria bacterium]|nr:hypothetical protein [Rhodospirillaceae bacterium]MDP6022560.1 hypothetical protein [Alphaproteobacteria bacterium]MEE1556762.1 hypothetical protein [Alphaproteobacteria bacterium]
MRPQLLLGLSSLDSLVHAVVWSVGGNAFAFIIVSLLTDRDALERLQGTLFVDVYRSAGGAPSGLTTSEASSEDLFVLAQLILGSGPASRLIDEMARHQGQSGGLPHATDAVIARLERELAASIGATSAHAMMTRLAIAAGVGGAAAATWLTWGGLDAMLAVAVAGLTICLLLIRIGLAMREWRRK